MPASTADTQRVVEFLRHAAPSDVAPYFLRGVLEWYEGRRFLTEGQIGAVIRRNDFQRWNAEHNLRVDLQPMTSAGQPDSALEALLAEEEEIEARFRRERENQLGGEEIAASAQAEVEPHQAAGVAAMQEPEVATADMGIGPSQIRNGVYKVSRQSDESFEHQYSIHTIERSRTTNMVGQRVVRHWENGQWETIGYLMTDGSFKPWRRIVNNGLHNPEIMRIKAMLAALRRDPVYMTGYYLPMEDGVINCRVTLVAARCVRCNMVLGTHTHRQAGHDGCASRGADVPRRPVSAAGASVTERRNTFLEEQERVRAAQQRLRQDAHASSTVVAERRVMSELGTGWLQ